MFTPPNTTINRCKERLVPSIEKGGSNGKVTLLFSKVCFKGECAFQLDIITTPKNHLFSRMNFQTSVIYRSADISLFEKPLAALLSAIEKTSGISVGNVEFNYYITNIEPITINHINSFIALDERLCEHNLNNNRQPMNLCAVA